MGRVADTYECSVCQAPTKTWINDRPYCEDCIYGTVANDDIPTLDDEWLDISGWRGWQEEIDA